MNPRFKAQESILGRELPAKIDRNAMSSTIFASNVFTGKVMKHYLSKELLQQLNHCIQTGQTINREIAGPVANAMKTWAMDKGATHYTHWFQPLTGLTAEKHESFFELVEGEALDKFGANELIQQEPDASSFPSGGLRNTFEARGYTAWDPASSAFILETRFGKTLCIPTIFISYNGEALDYKLPLLKTSHLLDEVATQVCQYFDKNITKVTPPLGPEQEYFLIDRAFYTLRPDLQLTGRTVFGALPPRGQQLEDHYFGSIPERVLGFMQELEIESHKVGIPLKTRHNEVAPNQFECAPIFEDLNVAIDHAQLLMDLIEKVVRKHHFQALLHEKPFAGINGSGKHNNWSMATDTGKNLLSPGKNPQDNLMFLTFFVNVIKAVYEHADLLRASIASAGNDHRLGANEAPPAIISAFIGSELTKILEEIITPHRKERNSHKNPYIELGITKIPEILRDNTDRNRTSPFAFTGNKFEFRAVGSSANSANAMTVLNLIVANQLREFKIAVDKKIARGKKVESAILDVVKEYIISSSPIRFEGNGYSKEWEEEAAKRGLSNHKKTPQALDAYLSDKSKKLFEENKIFSLEELTARHEIMLHTYINKIAIEARVIEEMALSQVLPSAMKYQKLLTETLEALADLGIKAPVENQKQLVTEIALHVEGILETIGKIQQGLKKAHSITTMRDEAVYLAEEVTPLFAQIRIHADALEARVSDEYWILPKYREMLFVR